MVAGENDISVIRETTFLQLRENLPHAVIDEGNLTVIVGGHLCELAVGLRINAGIFHAEPLLRTLGLRNTLQRRPVPPRAVVQVPFMGVGDVYLILVVETTPDGQSKGWCGSG